MQEMNGLEDAGFAILLAVFLWIAFVAIINLVTLAWRGTKFCVSQLAKVFSRSTCFLIVSMFGVFVNTSLADSKVVLTITDSGYFETTVDSTGVPQSAKIVKILDLRTGGNTPTDTPPPTVPDDDQDQPPIVKPDAALVYEVEAIVKAVGDPQGAIGISRVYKHVAGAANDGTLKPQNVWAVAKAGSIMAQSETATKDWKEARDKLGQLITKELQTRKTKEDIVVLLCSIQYGLQLAGDGGQKLTGLQMAKIYAATQGALNASR